MVGLNSSTLFKIRLACLPTTVILNDLSGLGFRLDEKRALLAGITASKKPVATRRKLPNNSNTGVVLTSGCSVCSKSGVWIQGVGGLFWGCNFYLFIYYFFYSFLLIFCFLVHSCVHMYRYDSISRYI